MTDLSSKFESVYQNLTPAERQAFDANVDANLASAIESTARDAKKGINDARIQELTAEYGAEMMANRGNKQALKQIKSKYQSQGLNTDNITFNI